MLALGEISGSYTSPYARYRDLPAGAPTRTSQLRIDPDGGSLLTLGIVALDARASVRGGEFVVASANRWVYYPQFARAAAVPLPDARGACAGATGRYRYRAAGRLLTFTEISDPCGPRAAALTARPWHRASGA